MKRKMTRRNHIIASHLFGMLVRFKSSSQLDLQTPLNLILPCCISNHKIIIDQAVCQYQI